MCIHISTIDLLHLCDINEWKVDGLVSLYSYLGTLILCIHTHICSHTLTHLCTHTHIYMLLTNSLTHALVTCICTHTPSGHEFICGQCTGVLVGNTITKESEIFTDKYPQSFNGGYYWIMIFVSVIHRVSSLEHIFHLSAEDSCSSCITVLSHSFMYFRNSSNNYTSSIIILGHYKV